MDVLYKCLKIWWSLLWRQFLLIVGVFLLFMVGLSFLDDPGSSKCTDFCAYDCDCLGKYAFEIVFYTFIFTLFFIVISVLCWGFHRILNTLLILHDLTFMREEKELEKFVFLDTVSFYFSLLWRFIPLAVPVLYFVTHYFPCLVFLTFPSFYWMIMQKKTGSWILLNLH